MQQNVVSDWSPCPALEVLAAYSEGQLAEEALHAVAGHVSGCSVCESTLGNLRGSREPLLSDLRQTVLDEPFLREPECQELEARALAIPAKQLQLSEVPDSTYLPPRIPGFEIMSRIGQGGMGIVYRARQLSLNRDVAIKVLPPLLAGDPDRLKRFRNEAATAARLSDSRILQVFDILEIEGTPLLVMPYVEGQDLARIIRDRQSWRRGSTATNGHRLIALGDQDYLDEILPVLDKIVAAVAVVHEAKVLHRDIKPANCLIDHQGNLWLSDFGLARVEWGSRLTATGLGIGTRGFMSPEQWDGQEDVDTRADVFGLGATIYQALTLELPFGDGRVNKETPLPRAPSKQQPLLASDLDVVILKALEPNREDRYRSAVELHDDWRRVRQGFPPQARRSVWLRRLIRPAQQHPFGLLAAAMILVLLGMLAIFAGQRHDGGQPALTTARQNVELTTEPPGARVVLVPVNQYGEFEPESALRPEEGKKSPLVLSDVAVGTYLVVAEVPSYGFHEVYRTVPALDQAAEIFPHNCWEQSPDGTIGLPVIRIPQLGVEESMAFFDGGEFTMGPDCQQTTACPAHRRIVRPFYLDSTEVLVGDYKQRLGNLPDGLVKKYPHPPADFDLYPVSFVTFDQALNFAEKVGKRLPTETEYEFAATNGGRQEFPWGDDRTKMPTEWRLGSTRLSAFDRTSTRPPVLGLYSNVAEWTDSMLTPYDPRFHPAVENYPPRWQEEYRRSRVVRGAPPSVILGNAPDQDELRLGPRWLDPRWRQMERRDKRSAAIGFRCARSAHPRFLNE